MEYHSRFVSSLKRRGITVGRMELRYAHDLLHIAHEQWRMGSV